MTNEDVKGVLALVFTVLGYSYYVFPAMHAAFNPITFWQKLVMFFTLDILSIVLTLIVVIVLIEGLNKVYELITR